MTRRMLARGRFRLGEKAWGSWLIGKWDVHISALRGRLGCGIYLGSLVVQDSARDRIFRE